MRTLVKVFIVLLAFSQSWASTPVAPVLQVNQLPPDGLLLDKGWIFRGGDKAEWAKPAFDDRGWPSLDPTVDIYKAAPIWNSKIGWFRLHLSIDSSVRRQSLALLIEQTGASEIYVNGRLIQRLGQIGAHSKKIEAQTLPNQIVALPLNNRPDQVIAVRFALQKNIPYVQMLGRGNPVLRLKIQEVSAAVKTIEDSNIKGFEYFRTGIFFILAVLHLAFFWFYPAQRANLYFFLFSFLAALSTAAGNLAYQVYSVEAKMYLLIVRSAFGIVLNTYFYLMALYSLFELRRGTFFWLLSAVILLLYLPMFWPQYQNDLLTRLLFVLVVSLASIWVSVLAVKKKKPGAWVVLSGAFCFLVFFCVFRLMLHGLLSAGPAFIYGHWLINLSFISLPIAISLVLAQDFAFTSRMLGAKQIEVEQLYEKTLRQEREKRHLAEMNELKSRFFVNLSHEFRTPLALIRGTVEKLTRREGTASERQFDYQLIDRSAGQVLGMVNQLLNLSRLEAGELALQSEPGELCSLVRRLAGSFASLFESKQITYEYSIPLQPVWVAVDGSKLEQILSNLLSNAAKFTPKGGAVRFVTSFEHHSDHEVVLKTVVEDTGIGIAASELARIFDRFYQVDNSATRSYEGSGIGLSLVKELVKLHGGEVKVESTIGQGTTFTVQIPFKLTTLRAEARGEVAVSVPARIDPESPAVRQKDLPVRSVSPSARVLVVEDHAELRRFISEALGEQYAVQGAYDGLAGHQAALEHLPDLIISDVMMPGMDGIAFCQKLKTDQRTSHIPVILLTAKAGLESKLGGLETGADDYLTKPFSLEELEFRVKNLLESRRKLREMYGKQVTLNPKEITITSTDEQFLQRALLILEVQMSNPNFDVEIFSREIGMSRSQLNRKLTALTGQGPSDFIRTLRLKRAAVLLQSQAGNVSDVAYQVGYTNLSYFSKVFCAQFGQAPSDYLRGRVTEIS